MKKILSDDTIAKVGQIVVITDGISAYGNKTGDITEITSIANYNDDMVQCKAVGEYLNRIGEFDELVGCLRLADEDEISKYNK
jgi:uncharacterized protein YkvS